MQAKITKTAVDALKPGDMLADSEVKGFVVRRLPSGFVTYGLRYRANGKQRWLALGLHGRELTAEKVLASSPRNGSERWPTIAIPPTSARRSAPRRRKTRPRP